MSVDVAIVIVTFNSELTINGLLDSIPGAIDDLSTEIIVVDNGSTDGTLETLRTRGSCRVIAEQNKGYAAGVNRGVESAGHSKNILVLNPDVRLHPGCLRPLFEALKHTSVGIAAPRILSRDGQLTYSLRRETTILRSLGLTRTKLALFSEYVNRRSDYEVARYADWAVGAALLIDRRCHDKLGGWDESFFLYSEETDFCLRAREHGFKTMYVPSSVVTHLEGGSGRSTYTFSMQALSRVRLFRRRHGLLRSSVYFGLVVMRETARGIGGDNNAWPVVRSLIHPPDRPPELNCSRSLLPN